MAQLAEGYDLDIFLNNEKAKQYLCAICQCVLKKATSIGCAEDHMFCEQCLTCYFREDGNNKTCPSCREEVLNRPQLRASRFTDRFIESLKVRCQLQHHLMEEKMNEDDVPNCEWTGDLGDLFNHTSEKCKLLVMICEHCDGEKRRFEMEEHDGVCEEKELQCELNCNMMVKRHSMRTHIKDECSMTELTCCECKENVLRKDMDHHTSNVCKERLAECPYAVHGCDETVKHKELHLHLEKEELNHLKLQVKSMETQLLKVQNMEKSLSKVLGANTNKILMLLQSKNAYLCDIKSKDRSKANIQSLSDGYCIGKNISFNEAKHIGFNSEQIDVFGNNIVFGTSLNKITALCVNTQKMQKCKSVCVNVQNYIPFENYSSLYGSDYGLILIGGNDRKNEEIANRDVINITFDGGKWRKRTITRFPYAAIDPSVHVANVNMNETLFVCGGWWDKEDLSICYSYNFGNKQWKRLKDMNHAHQCGGICEWKEKGHKIIVAAGFEGNKVVEEYDIHKNIWIDLPNLNEKHDIYPALFTSNNILFCIGGVDRENDDLGCIELYDPRDKANKWIYVDTVQHYFVLEKDAGAGSNCFLPL